MILLYSIYFIMIIVSKTYADIYQEIFKVRSDKYKSFYTVDYKFIEIPKNIYELNIYIKFIRWIGFASRCPSSINITSVLQHGNFPLFKYDEKFQYNIKQIQKIEMVISNAEKEIIKMKFKLLSPKPGVWVFGSIYDINDADYFPILCLADLQVTLTGFIFNPTISMYLPPASNTFIEHVIFDKPGGKLIEVFSNIPLSQLRVSHRCKICSLSVTVAENSIPQINTLKTSKETGSFYEYNETIIDIKYFVMTPRLLLYVQSWSHVLTQADLMFEYLTISANPNVDLIPPLAKIRGDTLFAYKFAFPESNMSQMIVKSKPERIVVVPFFIKPIKDQGSILSIEISLLKNKLENYTIFICVAEFALSSFNNFNGNSSECWVSIEELISKQENFSFRFFYPQWNWWYITITIKPLSGILNINEEWKANLNIISKNCIHDSSLCNRKGVCLLTGLDTGIVSSCHCFKPYYGLDCMSLKSPAIGKVRDSEFRRNWLVYSNLAFIPAMVIAVIQKLFVLAFMYLATAGFSMVYHMCYMEDTDFAYCALKVEELVYYDHLAAVTSIWITMVSLSTLSYKIQMMLNVIMIFICIVLADVIQKSMWLYCFPIFVGAVILIICWGYRKYQLKSIFPPIDWWVIGLFPCLVIAGIGFTMFRLSVKHNYPYYLFHSMWHIFIALSICFVLPNSKRWSKALNSPSTERTTLESFCNSFSIRWKKFKKRLHLDVLLEPFMQCKSRWPMCKSY